MHPEENSSSASSPSGLSRSLYFLDMERHDDIMRAIGMLEGTVTEGFKSTHQRLDVVNGRLGKHDEKIGKLESAESFRKGQMVFISLITGTVLSVVGGVIVYALTHH